jgi:hypothetical protein
MCFDDLALLNAEGRETLHESRRAVAIPTLKNRSGEDAFIIPVTSGEVYYSPVQVDQETFELLMTISIPLFDLRTEELTYVVTGDFRLKAVTTLLQEQEFKTGQDIYVVSAGGGHSAADSGQEESPELVVVHKNPSVVLGNRAFETHDL